jgi:hypothetical protein
VLPAGLDLAQYASGDYRPVRSWARSEYSFRIERSPDAIEIICDGEALTKRLSFSLDGGLGVSYRWDPSVGQPEDLFAPELSLFAPLEVRPQPAADVWTFPIETVAKSERGLDRTRQGDSLTLRWPVHLGAASVEIDPHWAGAVELHPAGTSSADGGVASR